MKRLSNDGQGNCLFESVAQGLKLTGGGDHHHRSVRAATASHLKRHRDKYFLFWDHKDTMDKTMSDTTINGFDQYILQIARIGSWGGNLEVAALAATLDRPIHCIHETGQIYTFNSEGANKDLFLYYLKWGHYECLEVQAETALQIRTKALPGRPAGGRENKGGGSGRPPSSPAPSLGGCTKHSGSQDALAKRSGLRPQATSGGDSEEYQSGSTKRSKRSFHDSLSGNTSCVKSFKGSLGGHTRFSNPGGSSTDKKSFGKLVEGSLGRHTALPARVGAGEQVAPSSFGSSKSSAVGQCSGLGEQTKKGSIRSQGLKKDKSVLVEAHRSSSSRGPARFSNTRDDAEVAGNPLLVGKRAPKTSWTCNLCKTTFVGSGASKRSLTMKRANHIAARHAHEKEKVFTMREYSVPVEASDKLPLGERDWVCPFCPKALPALPASLKTQSVQHHYRTQHPRRKTGAARLNALRWKLAKKDPAKVVNFRDAKKQVGKKLQQRALARKDLKQKGHELVPVSVDWSSWPLVSAKQRSRTASLYTCVKCRTWTRGNYHRRCLGLRKVPLVVQSSAWKRLGACPQNRVALCTAWGISVDEAESWYSQTKSSDSLVSKHSVSNQWLRQLVQEGIEPHPGPESLSQVRIGSLNCHSANGCWAALDTLVANPKIHVLCVQETRMWPNEFASFKTSAARKGFHCYFQHGKSTGGVPRGGVAILIPRYLTSRIACRFLTDNSQLLGIWVENFCLFTFYAPPVSFSDNRGDAQMELCELFLEAFEALGPSNASVWISVGDANETPESSLVGETLKAFGGVPRPQGCSTRWNSDREIDWFASNQTSELSGLTISDIYISDHKLILADFHVPRRDLYLGTLQHTPDWQKPAGISPQDWTQLLDQIWDEHRPDEAIFELPVQAAWDWFNRAVDKTFRTSFRQFAHSLAEDGSKETLLRKCNMPHKKGILGKWTKRSVAKNGPPETFGWFRTLKFRRRLGRLCELKKVVLRLIRAPDPLKRAVQNSLVKKLARHFPELRQKSDDLAGLVQYVHQLIQKDSATLKTLEMDMRSQKIAKWRTWIDEDPKAIGRWLRNRTNSGGSVAVASAHGNVCTAEEITTCIFNYWSNFWKEIKEGRPDGITRDSLLQRHAAYAPVEWQDPSVDEVVRIARSMTGSGGVDGWLGAEIRFLPRRILEMFRKLAISWGHRKKVPAQFLEARCVMLPKTSKQVEGSIRVDDIRPITVMSCWWRLWSSCLVKCASTRKWVADAIPDEVISGSGPKAEAQLAAAAVLLGISNDGFGCTLDFSKCYDTLDPQGTEALLHAGHFPQHWIDTLSLVWKQQKRWIVWNRHYHSVQLDAACCMPQGDPWGPLALQMWMTSGLRFVSQNLQPRLRGGIDRVYMDDRSFSSPNPEGLLAKRNLWADWSGKVGLLENDRKTSFASSTARHARKLVAVGISDDQISKEFEILGVQAGFQPRTFGRKEQHRIDQAFLVLHLICCLRLSFRKFHLAARMYALSKCLYGWISRLPTDAVVRKWWAALRKGQRSLSAANPFLRGVLMGGLAHMDCVIGVNLLRVVHTLKHEFGLAWASKCGSPLHILKRWLALKGWDICSNWVWQMPGQLCTLDLTCSGTEHLKHLQHVLRNGWRWFCFSKFMKQARHDNQDMYVSLADFLEFDFAKMSRLLNSEAAFRSVMLGPARSPGVFANRANPAGFPTDCIWKCGRVGYWDHCSWDCDNRPSMVVCDHPLGKRLGWFRVGESSAHTTWLAKVVRKIWDLRYETPIKGIG